MDRPRQPSDYPWLQLIRVPNLLTVPGDPLVGYAVVAGGLMGRDWVIPVLCGLFFYAGGLIFNDLADLEVDRQERPNRPLPTGSISPGSARTVATGLLLVGLVTTLLGPVILTVVGIAVCLSVFLYNVVTKPIPMLGPLSMGVCRGLSVCLGAAAATAGSERFTPALPAIAAIVLYVGAVTHLAQKEMDDGVGFVRRFSPFIGAVLGLGLFYLWGTSDASRVISGGMTLWCAAIVVAGFVAWKAGRSEVVLSSWIGVLVSLLLFFQAAWLAGAGSLRAAACLVLAWPVFIVLGRWFYSS